MSNQYAVYPNDPTDLLTSAQGSSVSPTTIFNHAANEAATESVGYWCQGNSNFDGTNPDEVALCFYGVFGQPKVFAFTDSQSQNPYSVSAAPFIGGHPPHKPPTK